MVLRLQENDSKALAEILEKEDNQKFGYARKRLPDHQARKSSSKDALSIGHVQSYMAICQILSRRLIDCPRRSICKDCPVLFGCLEASITELNIRAMSSKQRVGVDGLLMELEEALDYHVLLFQYLCELYSQLQTGYLE